MQKKQKIFLTGGSGFLGSNLLRELISLNFTVFVLLREKSNLSRIHDLSGKYVPVYLSTVDLDELFAREKFVAIIHCATNYGRGAQLPLDILDANLILPLRLLQIGVASGVNAFINTDTVLDKRVNNYSLSKRHFRDWLQTCSAKIACVNVALEHFYGPDDDSSKFVTWVIHSLISGVDKIDLTLGEQKRDFVYIDDVVKAFTYIIADSLTCGRGFFHYEIGTGALVTITDFVKKLKQFVGNTSTNLNFGAIPYRKNEVMASSVDLTKILALGWKPHTSLDNGLNRTILFEKEKLK